MKAKPTEVLVEKIVEKTNDAEIHIEEPVKKKTTRKTISSRSTTSFKTR